MKLSNIEIVEHNASWAIYFKEEKHLIEKKIASYIKIIHHIGSTSIPKMPAKPIIDMLIEVINLDDIEIIESKLKVLGYKALHRSVMPNRSYVTNKQDNNVQYNCHIYEIGDPEIARYCRFRDYLIEHPADACAYAELKKKLADGVLNNITEYVHGKNIFVHDIDAKAKADAANQHKSKYLTEQNKGNELALWSNKKIVKSIGANFNLCKTYFAQFVTKINFIRVPGYVLVDSNLEGEHFNYILDSHFTEEEVEVKVEQLIAYFRDRNLHFTWWLAPNDTPIYLSQLLSQHVPVRQKKYISLFFDLDQLCSVASSLEYTIKIISTNSELENCISEIPKGLSELKNYLRLILDVYASDDPVKFYICYSNNLLVSCGFLALYAQLAGIYPFFYSEFSSEESMVATENYLLQQVRKTGYHLATMQVDEAALPKYFAHGFKQAGVFEKFIYNS